MNERPGFLITLEGIEGSGKTTHARRLFSFLEESGIPCLLTREPGGTPMGEKIRDILLNPESGVIDPLAETFLFEASRREHVKEVINPALHEGKVVICVRFTDSTLAYQGYGRGVPLSYLCYLNDIATEGVMPDLTVLFDVEPEVGLARSFSHTEEEELRFEKEFLASKEFLFAVRNGYLQLAKESPQRFVVVDTTDYSEEEVFFIIRDTIWQRLRGRG
ncbi:dTMP kinase [Candidatus Sordicultor fermentans]|jgi:dTMP kinase|uniref:dTMP kinase n=1 Tax=Candidatus Sordicultor fermentans TaxID=1953203 RepID=UPI0016A3680C|nr:dTMP kinase [Atribacterota bacterium]NLY05096.1 dTMP kinase [Candidatus Atribacteria bacterium]HOQ50522.1 dTMP kinase [Candidatus Atribacteria bacterium]HPZ39283.1 dTMP kinase [Candidatus Atribacteria bacterium]HQD32786.1 dTMP kinase [Candidatus Atribacteria bacterium]